MVAECLFVFSLTVLLGNIVICRACSLSCLDGSRGTGGNWVVSFFARPYMKKKKK